MFESMERSVQERVPSGEQERESGSRFVVLPDWKMAVPEALLPEHLVPPFVNVQPFIPTPSKMAILATAVEPEMSKEAVSVALPIWVVK